MGFGVLFVCTGNICRSPMAEVVFRAMTADRRLVDGRQLSALVATSSAGTAGWHEGSDMDDRARAALDRAGYVGAGSPARQATRSMLDAHDLVVVLDYPHLGDIRELSPAHAGIALLGTWRVSHPLTGVADPFYGDDGAFDECLAQIVDACAGLLGDVAARVS